MANSSVGTLRCLKKTFSADYSSLASGGRLTITATQLGYSIPQGYMPAGITYCTTGMAGVQFVGIILDGTENMIIINNTHSSARSGTVNLTVLFIPLEWALIPPDFLNPA